MILTVQIDIIAPIETVFEVISNPKLFVELESVVEEVEYLSKTRGKGMITRWKIRVPESNEIIINDEICIHYDPPYQMAYSVTKGLRPYSGVHTLSKNPDGTTHLHFSEVWHYNANKEEKIEIIKGLVENVKRHAEKNTKRLSS